MPASTQAGAQATVKLGQECYGNVSERHDGKKMKMIIIIRQICYTSIRSTLSWLKHNKIEQLKSTKCYKRNE